MKYLKVFQTENDYKAAKDNLIYPTVSHIADSGENHFMVFPPIKAVFYDSATGTFVKLYPCQITEANPNYTPIGVEVVPAEHNVYGTGQAGIMSLAEMNYNTPDTGSTEYQDIYWGERGTDTSLLNYDVVNYIGTGATLNDGVVQGTDSYAHLPSDQFSTVTGLDGKSGYDFNSTLYCQAPSPYNADGSRNEAYYTTAYSTANALSDFDGVGNTAVLTELATSQSDWKTASSISNSGDAGYHPAACCCWRFHTVGTNQGQWYLPTCGEFGYVINRISAINESIDKVLSVYSSVIAVKVDTDGAYWSSSEYNAIRARVLDMTAGNVGSVTKAAVCHVRSFFRL